MDKYIHSPIHLLQFLIPGRHGLTIDFLRAENQILRKRISGRLRFTDSERRTLVKYGLRIRDCLEQVATLVKPETILAWNRQFKKHKWDYSKRRGGRRRKRDDVEEIAVRLAMECVGIRAHTGRACKIGTCRVAQLDKKRAYQTRYPAFPTPERDIMEGVHQCTPGLHLGNGLLHRRGMDTRGAGHLLRAVLHTPINPEDPYCRLYAQSKLGMGLPAGAELPGHAGRNRRKCVPLCNPRPGYHVPCHGQRL